MQDILLDAIFVLYYVQKNNNEGCVHVQKKCNTLLGEIRLHPSRPEIELIRWETLEASPAR